MDKQVFKRWSIERPATCMHKTRRLVPNLNRSFLIKIFSQIWETFHFSRLKVDIVMIAIVVQNLKGPRFLDLLKWMILTLLWFVCNLLSDVEDSGDDVGLHVVEMGHQLCTVCVFSDKKWEIIIKILISMWSERGISFALLVGSICNSRTLKLTLCRRLKSQWAQRYSLSRPGFYLC